MPYDRNIERKSLTLDNASIDDDGLLVGYASVFGNVDRAGEVVVKGAFKNLDAFLRDGFVAIDHDWSNSIATVEYAVEDEYGLKVAARFHSTPDAQAMRVKVMERLSRGKSVGLSIGYVVTDDKTVDGVRYLHSLDLYEFSVVQVACNELASVSAAKGTRLNDQSTNALTVVGDLVQRFKGLKDMRVAQNRKPLGTKAIDTLEATISGLNSLIDELESLINDSDTETTTQTESANAQVDEASTVTDEVATTATVTDANAIDPKATDDSPDIATADEVVDLVDEDDVVRVYAQFLSTLNS